MAKIDYVVDIDLNDNHLLNAVIQTVNTLPASGVVGKVIYYTTDSTLRYWDGTQWQVLATGGTVPLPSTAAPAMDGTASAGTSGAWARGDHVHPSDTSKVDANASISGGTKCKITYDSKGLVTGGANLAESDIPALSISKVTGLQTALDSKQDTSAKDAANGYAGLDANKKISYTEIPTGNSANTIPLIKGTIGAGEVLKYSSSDGGFVSASIAAVLTYKGSCTYAQLPSTGQQVGDVWNVTDAHGTTPAGTNYAWNGTAWDPLGGDVDLSNYVTNDALSTALAGYAPKSHASSGTTYGAASASNYGHAKASSATPAMDGTAAVGTDNGLYARGDHVHPTDTSRASATALTNHTGNSDIHVTASDKSDWGQRAKIQWYGFTGDGSKTSFSISTSGTFTFGAFPLVQVVKNSSGSVVYPSVSVAPTSITVSFNTAPASAEQYTVVAVGL